MGGKLEPELRARARAEAGAGHSGNMSVCSAIGNDGRAGIRVTGCMDT